MLTLAEAAHDDGTKAFPKVATIAVRSNLSERQVQRCLRNLVELGEIAQTGTTRSGTNIYSVVGYINHEGGDNLSPLEGEGGDAHVTPGVTPTSPELSVEPSVEQLHAPAAQNGVRKGRERNDIWDALETMFGPAVTRSEQTRRGKVVASLKAAGATPEEMFARAKRWPRHFESATLTENAFEKWYSTLDPSRKPLRRQ